MKVLLIDNFDSFIYNLADEFKKRGCGVVVYRNDLPMNKMRQVVDRENPGLAVISPGPGTPALAGCCIEFVRAYADRLPLFGVCLGHQCLVEAFGGVVGRAPEPVHGKPSRVRHNGTGLYAGLENPLQVGRYHSLCAHRVPELFEVESTAGELVMGIRHRRRPVFGVQFHPESILTPQGGRMIENMIRMAGERGDSDG
jgi:anthranilate synthase component 2